MVSWKSAFTAAVKVVLYSVGWWIIGIFLIWLGASNIPYYTIFSSWTFNWPSLAVYSLSILGGFIIILLGGLATIMKVFIDLLEEQVRV